MHDGRGDFSESNLLRDIMKRYPVDKGLVNNQEELRTVLSNWTYLNMHLKSEKYQSVDILVQLFNFEFETKRREHILHRLLTRIQSRLNLTMCHQLERMLSDGKTGS